VSRVGDLWLTDFRCYQAVELSFPEGLTVLVGGNGQGKTSMLEAVYWLTAATSFRDVPDRALVREGVDRAYVRARVVDGEREELLEVELNRGGRTRVQRNRTPLRRTRDLLGTLHATVFAPDDLELVKGAPARRRAFLDELLTACTPRYGAVRTDYDRTLRHRNALLRKGIRGRDDQITLEVFDDQLVQFGSDLLAGRLHVIERVLPAVQGANSALTGVTVVVADYRCAWTEARVEPDSIKATMRKALETWGPAEKARGTTLVGPHRDDWALALNARDARTEASQGEQRTLALALRLGGHHFVAATVGAEPVLMLDDVFSELDVDRANALIRNLPQTQTLLTTAIAPPEAVAADAVWRVHEGRIST